mmetsp:Transcript_15943/g.32721  ORF Transcript_15943/g.32721 Transcript_15943/m.32721 type:complete len:162 (-) Transcript_15943:70-555(-)
MFLNLFIVNKSGGLIYNIALSPSSPPLNTNDSLRIGSTFHSLHAIAVQASPNANSNANADASNAPPNVPQDGIETITAGSGLTLKCLQTLTGTKFIITATDIQQSVMSDVLREVYGIYSDYALKNPFYELEMPVRGTKFDAHVRAAVQAKETGSGFMASRR